MSPVPEFDPSIAPTDVRRGRFGAMRTLLGLFGAPSAWLAQLMLSEPLVAHACYPYQAPLSKPIWEGLPGVLAAVSLICLVVALLSGFVAWDSWRLIARRPSEAVGFSVESNKNRSRFLVKLSLMSSFIFLIAVVFNACALLFVPLCSSWY
ncbi:hypothetical protein [Methylomicrobium sp. Wu6]|uniref:hypothetical protein n=1 Tax=Methylomicrobium sp. Wu6 TaxID=3107928 RepID=UPI002DD654F6|nr:hypothetical protein [Methylomicrobium sp. Wu6]MEC4748889.1 hypothetical protein [Methylomicrobium sp. Wu6]